MQNKITRKPLRLIGYDYSLPGAYFITICVEKHHEIFGSVIVGDDVHIVPFVELNAYGSVVDKHIHILDTTYQNVSIDCYVVMPNHIHMVIIIDMNGSMRTSTPTRNAIPQMIRSFKTCITKELGFSVWQRSYYEHIIRDDTDLTRIREYINNNPANWKTDLYFK
jgi:REP element-mobilizing transposase RayT